MTARTSCRTDHKSSRASTERLNRRRSWNALRLDVISRKTPNVPGVAAIATMAATTFARTRRRVNDTTDVTVRCPLVGNCNCVHYLRYTGRGTGDILCRCSHFARSYETGQINDVVQRLHIDLRPNFRVLVEPRLHVSGDLSVAWTTLKSAFSLGRTPAKG